MAVGAATFFFQGSRTPTLSWIPQFARSSVQPRRQSGRFRSMGSDVCAGCHRGSSVEIGEHTPGGGSCSACGSPRVRATATPGATRASAVIDTPTIQLRLEWSSVWLTISREMVSDARRARDSRVPRHESLNSEFQMGLLAVASAAFAVEAEQRRAVRDSGGASEPPTRPWKRNAGDWLANHLFSRGLISAEDARCLGELFDLRNKSVHPTSEFEEPRLHPTGTNTSPEMVAYNVDAAEPLVEVAARVIEAMRATVAP